MPTVAFRGVSASTVSRLRNLALGATALGDAANEVATPVIVAAVLQPFEAVDQAGVTGPVPVTPIIPHIGVAPETDRFHRAHSTGDLAKL